jgi:hypothetical protein
MTPLQLLEPEKRDSGQPFSQATVLTMLTETSLGNSVSPDKKRYQQSSPQPDKPEKKNPR